MFIFNRELALIGFQTNDPRDYHPCVKSLLIATSQAQAAVIHWYCGKIHDIH